MGQPELGIPPQNVPKVRPESGRPSPRRARAAGRDPSTAISGQRVLVVGLGRFGGGSGVTRWLVSQGARVTVTDQAPAESLVESIEGLGGLPLTLHLGGHDPADLQQCDLVIVNPGVVKSKSAFFQEIIRRGIPWTTEINLFCQRCPAPVIGVTGSFGKSTTCAMLAEALQASLAAPVMIRGHTKRPMFTAVRLGGNIGYSLLMDLPDILISDIVVLELSNAQLEDLPRINWVPDVAVITNLWPHHLDRYSSFKEYVSAKLNILRTTCNRQQAIGNRQQATSSGLWDQLSSRSRPTQTLVVGDLDPQAEAMLEERLAARSLVLPAQPSPFELVRVDPAACPTTLRIPGKHNQANAACVRTVCSTLGLAEDGVRATLAAFAGLPHRIQYVATIEGVDYFNDSKSTSPAATQVAVESFDRPIVAIVGGQCQEVPLTILAEILVRSCQAVICTGESGATLAEAVRGAAVPSRPVAHRVERLDDAVRMARHVARSGDVVLFSPGAPSFDRYTNFTQRGDHFVQLVQAMQNSRLV